MHEQTKAQRIAEAFDAAYKSPLSVLVLDNLERLIDYVGAVPARFSNTILQTISVLVNKRPPKGRKLLIIATTSNSRALKELQMFDVFDAHIRLPFITSSEELKTFLSDRHIAAFQETPEGQAELERVVQSFPSGGKITVKKLIMLLEMSRQGAGGDKDFADRVIQRLQALVADVV